MRRDDSKRRKEFFAFRLRESERESLRTAARKVGKWDSELAREAINQRVLDILGSSGVERITRRTLAEPKVAEPI